MTRAVLGIDPSLTRTAFALRGGDQPPAHWVVSSPPTMPLGQRLRRLSDAAYEIAALYHPAMVVMEEPGFIAKNHSIHAIYSVGRAQGAILAGLPSDVEALIVTVQVWRAALGIKIPRGAGKQPIYDYLNRLGIPVPLKSARGSAVLDDDVADAKCLALYGEQRLRGS